MVYRKTIQYAIVASIIGSGLFFQALPTHAAELRCEPDGQNVPLGAEFTFSAVDGEPEYTWVLDDEVANEIIGPDDQQTVKVKFKTVGSYFVSVVDGSSADGTCSGKVVAATPLDIECPSQPTFEPGEEITVRATGGITPLKWTAQNGSPHSGIGGEWFRTSFSQEGQAEIRVDDNAGQHKSCTVEIDDGQVPTPTPPPPPTPTPDPDIQPTPDPVTGGSGRGTPLVPCGGKIFDEAGNVIGEQPECRRCHFVALVDNIMTFLTWTVMPVVGGILFIYAGFLIMFGGATNSVSTGRSIFTTTALGIVLIASSYMLTNFILRTIGGEYIDRDISTWYSIKIECSDGFGGIVASGDDLAILHTSPPPTPTPESQDPLCSDPEKLAQKYNNARYPRGDAVETILMKGCINTTMEEAHPDVDWHGSIFTYEHSNELCNYTRGRSVCGKCAHSVDSWHYGGANSGKGSLAIDYGNEDFGDEIIAAARACGATEAGSRCEGRDGSGRVIKMACSDPRADHIHITVPEL